MSTIRKLFATALLALPVVSIGVGSAEAGSRIGGYSNHGSYNQPSRGYGRAEHVRPRKAWFGRMHASRRGFGFGRRH